MKIGIDIDGVVADFFKKFLEFYNRETGNNILIENWVTYNFWDFIPITKENGKKLMEDFYSLDEFDEIPLIEGAKEAMLQLSEENEIFVITARPLRWKEKTKDFFDKHFSEKKIKLIHSRDNKDKIVYKREICNNLGIELLIEDCGDIALQCAEIGVMVILLDRPYNKGSEHENILRVKNWDEILKEIDNMQRNLQRKDNETVEKIRQFVEEECKKPTSKYGYDPYESHFIPVVKYSKLIAEKLNADVEIVELAAWLHDIGSIIDGRENHHLTGSEIAEQKLRELNYPEERIEQIKHCIFSHRGSKNLKRETIEAQILADADVMSHFDNVGGIFKAAFVYENHTQMSAQEAVKNKLINSYNKLSREAKKIIQPKFEAALLLFG